MELTVETRAFISGTHRGLGWHGIPDTCPEHVANSIVEWRVLNFPSHRKVATAHKVITAPKVVAVTTETKREQMRKRLALTSL
jgi:hypothetical protein